MQKNILFFLLLFLSTQVFSQNTEEEKSRPALSYAFVGGYENNKGSNAFKLEAYLNMSFKMFNRNSDLRVGANTRSFDFDFDGVNDLGAFGLGFFADVTVYPFDNGFFTGVRWEALNLNMVNDESKKKYDDLGFYSLNESFTGTCFFLQFGYAFKIDKKFTIKLYAQPGVQEFSVSSLPPINSGYDMINEMQFRFLFNANISFEFRFQ